MKKIILHYINKYIIHDKQITVSYDAENKKYIYKEKISEFEFRRLKNKQHEAVKKERNHCYKSISLEQFISLITYRIHSILWTSRIFSFVSNVFIFLIFAYFNSWIIIVFFPASYFFLYMLLRLCFDKLYFRVFLQCNEIVKSRSFFTLFDEKINALFESDLVCNIELAEKNENLKYYGGSKELYTRYQMHLSKSLPLFIVSGNQFPVFKYDDSSVWIFPDFLLICEKGICKTLLYSSSYISYKEKIFYEYIFNPADSKKVGENWLYQTKKGNRDKRFKNNRKIPVMVYGEFIISSKEHVSLRMQISNIKIAHSFALFLKKYAVYYEEELYFNKRKQKSSARDEKKFSKKQSQKKSYSEDSKKQIKSESDELWPYTILDIPVTASNREIKKAYRSLVKLHHPDKHKTKDSQTYERAEYNIKLINSAYEYLIKRV